MSTYDPLIKRGDLKSSVYNDGKHTGTKLVGNFDKDTYGTAVLLKTRSYTDDAY